jgi:putative serine protease PepD
VAFGKVPSAPEQSEQPARPASDATMTLGKVPASAAEAPAAPEAPTATEYIDAPPPAVPSAGYVEAPPPVAPAPVVEAPANPYSTQPAPQITAGVPAASGAPQEPHHPFGAGHPVGDGWGGTGAPAYSNEGGYPAAGGPGYPGGPGGEYPATGFGEPAPRKKGKGGLVALVAAIALVAGLAGGFTGAALKGGSSTSTGASHNSTTVTIGGASGQAVNRPADSIAGIVAKALPSTVTIKAEGSSESGTGTGFVFDTEGHILTNNHVVAPAQGGGKLTVKFPDGSTYPASVVGQAKGYDIAVVKLDNPPTGKLVPLPLADSDQTQVGDQTIAIGAPYDLESTVTSGIVSAKNRPVQSGDPSGNQTSYMMALQTDASINPGNSGGPLLNDQGAVIGVNSAIQSNSGGSGGGQAGSIGLGFAIPINQAKRVAQMLIKTGTPVYATLGILRNDDYQNGDGAQVQTQSIQGTPPVTPGGPADKAGIKPGDVITKLGGVPIDGSPALVAEIWTHSPGDQVQVDYTRNGQSATATVTLGSRSGDTN